MDWWEEIDVKTALDSFDHSKICDYFVDFGEEVFFSTQWPSVTNICGIFRSSILSSRGDSVILGILYLTYPSSQLCVVTCLIKGPKNQCFDPNAVFLKRNSRNQYNLICSARTNSTPNICVNLPWISEWHSRLPPADADAVNCIQSAAIGSTPGPPPSSRGWWWIYMPDCVSVCVVEAEHVIDYGLQCERGIHY